MHKLYLNIFTFFLVLFLSGCGTGGVGGGNGSDDVQYAALGASDATGIGASPLSNGYVYLIKDGIENAGKSTNLMNYGVPDIQIGGIVDVELKLLDLGHKPNLVTLFTGTNDIIEGDSSSSFDKNLESILNHLQKIENVKIFIADLPDLTKLPRFKKEPDGNVTSTRIQEFNNVIHNQAGAFNAVLIKLSDEKPDDSLISNDGFHPNNGGYRRIADLFLQEILPVIITN